MTICAEFVSRSQALALAETVEALVDAAKHGKDIGAVLDGRSRREKQDALLKAGEALLSTGNAEACDRLLPFLREVA